jgi:hypothetical protein
MLTIPLILGDFVIVLDLYNHTDTFGVHAKVRYTHTAAFVAIRTHHRSTLRRRLAPTYSADPAIRPAEPAGRHGRHHPPRDANPRNCSWGPRNTYSCKSCGKYFLGPGNIPVGPEIASAGHHLGAPRVHQAAVAALRAARDRRRRARGALLAAPWHQ